MRTMVLIYLISLFLINNNLHHLPPFITCFSSFSSYNSNNKSSSISPMLCHAEESSALLGFLNSMTILYPLFTESWKKETDCCGWDGITCHPSSHHVVELVLFNYGLVGSLDSNSTLFKLSHLRHLELSWNDFSNSTISPKFGTSFPLLENLQLFDSNFSGEIPDEISHLSKLQYLGLSFASISPNCNFKMKKSTFNNIIGNMTHLSGLIIGGINIDSTIPPSITNLSSLTNLNLYGCNLRGPVPANILNLPLLQNIYLTENHDLYANFALSNWSTSLITIDLSHVNFSSQLSPSSFIQSQPNQLRVLSLCGCSLHGQIPDLLWNIFISNNTSSAQLDLSDNKLNGTINLKGIHAKFPNLDNDSSRYDSFNISYNSLTGSLTSLSWKHLKGIDLSYNMFGGPPPIPPIGVSMFSASNNNFTGYIHSSFCNLTSLKLLDLSNNNLNGELPHCFANQSHELVVLNLGSNSISGTLPDVTFSECSNLKYLDLSLNLLRGLVPRFLTSCISLEVLNLRSNKFKDKFPHWFGTFPNIQVLDLSNNDFFGPLPHSDASNPFPKLQVLDLSNNHFGGQILAGYIESFKAMMNITLGVGSLEYMKADDMNGYFYSITLKFNGGELKYAKIIKTLVTFDVSNNKFEGEIPNNIGQLVSIHGLNLAHNSFTGPIPKSLGNLTLLNSLDLSSNKLCGEIPQEITSLSSLGFFNVSENQLEGPIPHDNHLETFSVDSYKGNVGLCGFPLADCREHDKPRSQPSKNDNKEEDVGMIPEWKVVMMGCGFGTFVSFAWGCYMLSIGKPLWLLKLVLFLVDLLEKRLFGIRRRPRRGRN